MLLVVVSLQRPYFFFRVHLAVRGNRGGFEVAVLNVRCYNIKNLQNKKFRFKHVGLEMQIWAQTFETEYSAICRVVSYEFTVKIEKFKITKPTWWHENTKLISCELEFAHCFLVNFFLCKVSFCFLVKNALFSLKRKLKKLQTPGSLMTL